MGCAQICSSLVVSLLHVYKFPRYVPADLLALVDGCVRGGRDVDAVCVAVYSAIPVQDVFPALKLFTDRIDLSRVHGHFSASSQWRRVTQV